MNERPSDELLEVFKTHLRSNGQRFTPERQSILDEVLRSKAHFSAETLARRLQERDSHVSLATVYRTIPVLIDCGFIQRTVKQGDVEFYELAGVDGGSHHDHLLCVECGKIIEFTNEVIEEQQQAVAEKFGFKLESHSLVLRGVCRSCRGRN